MSGPSRPSASSRSTTASTTCSRLSVSRSWINQLGSRQRVSRSRITLGMAPSRQATTTTPTAIGRMVDVAADLDRVTIRFDQVAAAVIGHIVHHAEVLTLKAASYRLRDRGIDRPPQY